VPEPFEQLSRTPPVRGFLTRSENSNGSGIVLTHGAGANCDSPLLRAVADAFSTNGHTVLRCDMAFRQQRRFGPPRGSGNDDRESLRNAVLAMREIVSGPLYLGGHSYGGRMASMLAAEDPAIAAGLLLLSYPLHPPEKPEQLRTAHFAALRTPVFFVHGSRDPFATSGEVGSAQKLISAATRVFEIENAGHDLCFGRASKVAAAWPHEVADQFNEFVKTCCPAT
jgi:predicted alpha/beta-hydrolase family hydrolase